MNSMIRQCVWHGSLLATVMVFSSVAKAQCGGQSGVSPSGGRGSMMMNNASTYASNPLSMPGYASNNLSMPDYFRQAIAMQAQYNAIGVQMAAKQAAQQEAYDAMARPVRLANAQAKREAYEKRKAARLEARKSDSRYAMNDSR